MIELKSLWEGCSSLQSVFYINYDRIKNKLISKFKGIKYIHNYNEICQTLWDRRNKRWR